MEDKQVCASSEKRRHKCTLSSCLYGTANHILFSGAGIMNGKKYDYLIKSIGICRECNTPNKMVQAYHPPSGIRKELIQECDAKEYARLLKEKFHKLREVQPDKEIRDGLEDKLNNPGDVLDAGGGTAVGVEQENSQE